MKASAVRRDVQISDQVTHQSFRIGDSSKMFVLLADKIYSDKPRAVVREICCNALDAHMAAGVATPFKVSVPSALDPSFSVRDYGHALSHDEVMGLYTTFFDSTKMDTNDQIGGFGLGSKSPFAYTDAFTVVSIQNGKKRVYAAFRDEQGTPQISLASETDTNEYNGFEVKVPVKREDVSTFVETAVKVLKWFPRDSYEPFGFTVPELSWLMKTDGWGVLDEEVKTGAWNYATRTYGSVDCYALMGPVAYALDWSMADKNCLLPSPVVPIFEIGALDLPPSRETLSYDPDTIEALRAKRYVVTQEMAAEAERIIDGLDSWDRVAFASKLKRAGVHEICTRGSYDPKWEDRFILRGHVKIYKKPWSGDNGVRTKPDEYQNQKLPAQNITNGATLVVFDDMPKESPNKKRVVSRFNNLIDTYQTFILVSNSGLEYKDFDHLIETFGRNCKDLSFVKRLSELKIAEAKTGSAKTTYQMSMKSCRNGSGDFHDWGDQPASGDLWWPLNGSAIEDADAWYALAPYLHGAKVFGFTKTARAALDVNDFVRADVWVQNRLKDLMSNPDVRTEARACLRIRQQLNAFGTNTNFIHLLHMLGNRQDAGALFGVDFLHDINEMRGKKFSADAMCLAAAAKENRVNLNPQPGKDFVGELQKRYDASPLLQLAVRVRQRSSTAGLLAEDFDDLLKQLV